MQSQWLTARRGLRIQVGDDVRATAVRRCGLLRRGNDNVAVVNLLMIALQHYRAGLTFIAVEGASCDPWDLGVIDNGCAVEDHRYSAANERDVVSLPLTGLLSRITRRRNEAIDSAYSVTLRLLAEVVLNLNLVAPAKIDAAVAEGDHLELDVQLEVSELLLRNNVRAVRRVLHQAIGDAPRPGFARCANLPTGQIAPVENRYRLAPFRGRLSLKLRGSNRSPFERLARGIRSCSFEMVAEQPSLEL